MQTRKWKGKSYFHDEDEEFTSMEDAKHYANWMEKSRSDVSATKITKESNETYWVWRT